MQPSEQPEQHPIDYLDSISTVPKGARKGPSDKVFFGAIIGVLLATLVIGAIVFFTVTGSSTADLSTLSVRLNSLQTITDDAQKNIVSSGLRASNTNLSLVLANANRDIPDVLIESGIEPGKIDPKIAARESTKELREGLEDARLNAIFDRIYTREMTYQLDTVLILLVQLESETESESQREFLTTTYNNLKPLQESFAAFDAASS